MVSDECGVEGLAVAGRGKADLSGGEREECFIFVLRYLKQEGSYKTQVCFTKF